MATLADILCRNPHLILDKSSHIAYSNRKKSHHVITYQPKKTCDQMSNTLATLRPRNGVLMTIVRV